MPNVLEEKEAIRELFSVYCCCSDRADVSAFVALFTEDCVWDGGPWGRYHGRDALGAFMSEALGGGKASFRHLTANEIIAVAGDTATARSYVMVMSTRSNPPKPFFTGFYEDELVKRDDRWCFKSRIMQVK
jgi:uncharacterized protein (TIGR02246 family)